MTGNCTLPKRIHQELLDDLRWANEMDNIGMCVLARAIRKTVRNEIYWKLRNSDLPTKKARVRANEIYWTMFEKVRDWECR